MTLQVYNALTNEKEPFTPLNRDTVKMYVCGQTVYDNMHIGHGRTYIAFDIIRRYLQFKGYAVETVINVTDVNDKINTRAQEEDREPEDVAAEYTRINLEDFKDLGVKADVYTHASDYIPEMIDDVETLIENGYAYEANGNVFFNVHAMDDYGKLSNQDVTEIEASREDDITDLEDKKHPEDFVLWRSRNPETADGPTWDSPWGTGVPGWHIECSTMATHILGDQFDIHGGGADLVFPHHEDEIAQAEGVTGETPWVQYWMHAGLVRMGEEKMSKSLDNFVSTRELLEEYDPDTLRLFVASTHYRKPFTYSEEKLQEAVENRETLRNAKKNVDGAVNTAAFVPDKFTAEDVNALHAVFDHREGFVEAMDDDFNTAAAVKQLLALATTVNQYVNTANDPKRPILERMQHTLTELGNVIGVFQDANLDSSETEAFIDVLVETREKLREEELYELSDWIRDKLAAHGVELQDTDSGVRWTRSRED